MATSGAGSAGFRTKRSEMCGTIVPGLFDHQPRMPVMVLQYMAWLRGLSSRNEPARQPPTPTTLSTAMVMKVTRSMFCL